MKNEGEKQDEKEDEMKTLKSGVLTLILGALVLWISGGAAKAQIDPFFQAGDSWHGFSWNPGNTAMQDMRLAVWSARGNTFLGGVSLFGKGRAVSGRFSTDGSVAITEVNSSVPITMVGRSTLAGDGSATMLIGLSQGGRSLGMARLLRLFPALPLTSGGALPPDPYFPPGPCYVGSLLIGLSSISASLTVNPTPPNPTADRPQPSDVTGTLLVGDVSYSAVLCIDRNTLPNGNYKFDMIAHAVDTVVPCVKPVMVIPCIRVSGELHPGSIVPCIRNTQWFAGSVERFDNNMALLDRGKISLLAP